MCLPSVSAPAPGLRQIILVWVLFCGALRPLGTERLLIAMKHAICKHLRLPLSSPMHPARWHSVREPLLRQGPSPKSASNHAFLCFVWPRDAPSIMDGVPVHCHAARYLRIFAVASSFLVASSRMARSWQYLCACGVALSHPAVLSMKPFRPHASSPPVLRSGLRQSVSFWVLRGRGARLHSGGNSPPVWRECPSTAKSMLSAFACGCLFLPSCFQ